MTLEPIRPGHIVRNAAPNSYSGATIRPALRGAVTRGRFLTELTLDLPDASGAEAGRPQLDEDYLILSTIHSVKLCGARGRLQKAGSTQAAGIVLPDTSVQLQ